MEKELLEKNPDPRLRAYVVWVRKTFAMEADVRSATSRAMDPRATHYWDGEKALMAGYRQRLGMHEEAWDIYLLYAPGAKWEGAEPPKPDFWMQQLGVPDVPPFEPVEFARQAERLLSAAPAAP